MWLSCFLQSVFYCSSPVRFIYTCIKRIWHTDFQRVLWYHSPACTIVLVPVVNNCISFKWHPDVQVICSLWFLRFWHICIHGLPFISMKLLISVTSVRSMIPEILAYLYSCLTFLSMKSLISAVCHLHYTILLIGMACWMTTGWYDLFASIAKTLDEYWLVSPGAFIRGYGLFPFWFKLCTWYKTLHVFVTVAISAIQHLIWQWPSCSDNFYIEMLL